MAFLSRTAPVDLTKVSITTTEDEDELGLTKEKVNRITQPSEGAGDCFYLFNISRECTALFR